jgi:hypothetical protein
MKARTTLALAALICLAAATTAAAGPAPTRAWKRQIQLEALDAGARLAATGTAMIGRKNGVEFFRLRASAQMVDGDAVTAWGIDNSGQLFLIGTMEMVLGSGVLDLVSSKDPSDVFPVGDLAAVVVTRHGEKILRGTF